ncbi:hypothetical protein DFAR_2210079 [Desulfarculales bacterium]
MPTLSLTRWTSNYSNARLERLNGIFQTARTRARGYRNVLTVPHCCGNSSNFTIDDEKLFCFTIE